MTPATCRNCGSPTPRQRPFCCKACFDNWQTGRPAKRKRPDKIKKVCKRCGKDFEVTPGYNYRVYCSKSCSVAAQIGRPNNVRENNPGWRGGVTPQNEIQRKARKYDEWRNAVFKRDNYTCQDCKKHGGHLHAHHIEPFATNKAKRFDVSNGVTLCVLCHANYHPKISKLIISS